MRVVRDFDEVYASDEDPWSIGAADSERYNLYYETILRHSQDRGTILDVGCGYGAFLARFREQFNDLYGVDVARQAIEGGKRRHPFIHFRHGAADRLPATLEGAPERFDCIIYSDVIAYLTERGKNRSLGWIARHLEPEGFALIAGWSPGKRYPTASEFRRLVARHFVIEEEQVLDSDHALFVARPKRLLVALTLDYETWQPIPPGRRIDWEVDVFDPTEALLAAADRQGAKITLMAELGEYFWLWENDMPTAERMERQWADAVQRGHDVQVHLHPDWLPELGARREGDRWTWDRTKAVAADYPGDLVALIGRCKARLEEVACRVNPEYRAVSFRAGGYEAQPFERLASALTANSIRSDTSVYAGGRRADRHHDYSLARSPHQPWFASPFDPQLEAPPAERQLIELPIFAFARGQRWSFDGEEGAAFADRLIKERRAAGHSVPTGLYRMSELLLRAMSRKWFVRRVLRRWFGRFEPGGLQGADAQHDYRVLVGHSKADLDIGAIENGLARLRDEAGADFLTISELTRVAEEELSRPVSHPVFPGPHQDDSISQALMDSMPLDRERVFQLADESSPALNGRSWVKVEAGAAPRHSGAYDCVIADRSLERAEDPQRVLNLCRDALQEGGVLVAAIHSDARVPEVNCGQHPWKTEPGDVRRRLRAAGYEDVAIQEVDAGRRFGYAHSAAADRVMLVRAWRRERLAGPVARIDELAGWVRDRLDPSTPSVSADPIEIIATGHAWCAGAAIVLGEALRREGYETRWVTMLAVCHPHGEGPQAIDSHEVVAVRLSDGSAHVVDPQSGVRFPSSIEQLLSDPSLANVGRREDDRYRERRYDLYSTRFWYERVRRVAIRSHLDEPHHYVVADQLCSDGNVARRAWSPNPKPVRLARALWHYRLLPAMPRCLTGGRIAGRPRRF